MNLSGAAGLSQGAISARIDRLPATRTIWTIVALLGFGMFFELYDLLFSAYVAPSLVKSGVLTATTAGLFGTTGVASFIAALFTGLFIGTILCGFLADRFGRRAIFTWSLLWYSAANVMVAFQHDAAGLNFWRLISGVGLGVEIVTIGAYLSEIAPKGLRGRAFAVNQAIGFVCVPVISFLAWLLVPTAPLGLQGWRWVVLIGALAAPVVVFLRRGLPESPRWLAKHGRLAEADQVLRALEAKVEAEYGRPLPPPGPGEPVSPASGFRDLWLPGVRGRVILMSVFNIFQTIGFYGFANWIPSLLVKQGITVSTSLGYTTLIALAAPSGRSSDSSSATDSSASGSSWLPRALFWSAASFLARRSLLGSLSPWGSCLRSPPTSCRSAFTPTSRSCSRPEFALAPRASSIRGAASRSFSHPSSSPSCSSAPAPSGSSFSSPWRWAS